MQAKLTVTGGKANKNELSLKVPVIVGRSRGAGLTIAHPMVSRQHCEIFEAGGLLRIRDLGSTNGTYVSGTKVEEAVLRPHDQFTIGPLTFEVDYQYVGDSTVVEERYQDSAAAARAAALSPEAYPAGDQPAPEATPSPEGVEAAGPSAEYPEAYAELAEPPAPAEPAGEGFDFLESLAEPDEPPAAAEFAGEGFELLEPSAEPAVAAESSDDGFAFMEAPAEPFESVVAAEPPLDLIASAEPPMEFAAPGPGVPASEFSGIAPLDGQVPNFSDWSKVPIGNVAAASAEESIAPPGFELPQDDGPPALPSPPPSPPDAGFSAGEAPIWEDASGDSGAEGQEPSALDSESNPWEDSFGETQTTAFAPSKRPKTKKGWWPFGKGK